MIDNLNRMMIEFKNRCETEKMRLENITFCNITDILTIIEGMIECSGKTMVALYLTT